MKAVWTFPGYVLILLRLGGTTWRAFPKPVADVLGCWCYRKAGQWLRK